MKWGTINSQFCLDNLRDTLSPLIGAEVHYLALPRDVIKNFEPSQIGTIVGTLTDAVLPYIALEKKVGLHKGVGILGDREGYPDFNHSDGYRIELKGLFIDNPEIELKLPPTRREPSARLTQKVTVNNVNSETDALMVLSYKLETYTRQPSLVTPVITDIGLFPVIECIKARDHRLIESGGIWFGDYQTPAILSNAGKRKIAFNQATSKESYGRKESEGKDYNEDTNFGKLKRIPYEPLQRFLKKNGASYSARGTYPAPWIID